MTPPQPTRWERAADKLTNAIPYVGGGAIIIPCLYMIWFLYHGQSISTDTTDWGTFGDFVGGILNPVVAFFALLLLMVSIGIQREELKATRKELKDSSDAQKQTVLHNKDSKGIEDCKIYMGLIDKKLTELLTRSSPYKVSNAPSLMASGSKLYNFEKLLTNIHQANHTNVYQEFKVLFSDDLIPELTNHITSAQAALQRWENLHGYDACFAVDYYKEKYKIITHCLESSISLDEKVARYYLS